MISGFLTSVISSSDHASISRNALRWLLISTIFYSGFFSSEAFDKRTNRVSTDVADKHARYISGVQIGEVEKVTNELGDNGAHRCVDYCFCKRTAIISAAKVRHCKRKDFAPMPCSFAAKWRPTGHVFWHLHVLPPIKDLLYLIIGIRSITDRTNPGYCV